MKNVLYCVLSDRETHNVNQKTSRLIAPEGRRYHTSNQIELSKLMGINFIPLSSQNKQRINHLLNIKVVFIFTWTLVLMWGGPCLPFPDINK